VGNQTQPKSPLTKGGHFLKKKSVAVVKDRIAANGKTENRSSPGFLARSNCREGKKNFDQAKDRGLASNPQKGRRVHSDQEKGMLRTPSFDGGRRHLHRTEVRDGTLTTGKSLRKHSFSVVRNFPRVSGRGRAFWACHRPLEEGG